MHTNNPHKFYVGLYQDDGKVVGHVVSVGSPPQPDASQPESQGVEVVLPDAALDFHAALDAFLSVMDSYGKFLSLTLAAAPFLSTTLAGEKITRFVERRGQECTELSSDNMRIFEINLSHYHEFTLRQDEVLAVIEGAKHLPEVMIIGLVSVYDAFLTRLLRIVLFQHEHITLVKDKQIAFADLINYSTIEDAKTSLIDREIESIMRSSHKDQILFMQSKFKMDILSQLDCFPIFIEVCARRNLLTHTGGVVSSQYISSCKTNGCDVSGVKMGERLRVDADYFSRSVDVFYEVGVKICHMLWCKFNKHERADADNKLNSLCFNLLFGRSYKLAESLLTFGVRTATTRTSEETRRMMIINLANSMRLQSREKEACQLLDQEDWSATSLKFKICIAAVKQDMESITKHMHAIGTSGEVKAEDYRLWPVFRGLSKRQEFLMAFERTFSEPYIIPRVTPPSGISEQGRGNTTNSPGEEPN